MNGFPEACFDTLGCYVYRLIDPRNGKTFYIGRGRGNSLVTIARKAWLALHYTKEEITNGGLITV